jgi:anti-sigma B factor antagonist
MSMMGIDADFAVSEAVVGGVPIVAVRGEIDIATAPQFRHRLMTLADGNPPLAIVDLDAVTFLDSTALGVLVNAVDERRDAGGDVHFVVTEPHVIKVLSITGLDEVFSIYPDLVGALSR